MSQENVDVVRASFEAWNAGDMEAWSGFLAPDVIWRVEKNWPEQGPFIGREAVLRAVQQGRETWDTDTAEPIGEFFHAADRVAVRFVWHGHGHGPESHMEMTCVYTVREGMISAFEFFWDHAEALKIAGLTEQEAEGKP
jgi:ketosteroid isomerase-like protein